jgi:hypothetical protein
LLPGIDVQRRSLPVEQRWRRELRKYDLPKRSKMLHDQRLPAVHRPRFPPLLPVRHLYEGLGLLRQILLLFGMEMLW